MEAQQFLSQSRQGEKPKTGSQPPHLQFTQQSPKDMYNKLAKWAFSVFPGVREEPSRISLPGTRALWLDESIKVAHSDAIMPAAGTREFAHLHEDGSMHLNIAEELKSEIFSKKWGEIHPWVNRGINSILVYAARSEEDLEVIKVILAQSYKYATGKDI